MIDELRKLFRELDEVEGRIQADMGRKNELEELINSKFKVVDPSLPAAPKNGKATLEERVLELLSRPKHLHNVESTMAYRHGSAAGVRKTLKKLEKEKRIICLRGKYQRAGELSAPPKKPKGSFTVDPQRVLAVLKPEAVSVGAIARGLGYDSTSGSVITSVRYSLQQLLLAGQAKQADYQYLRPRGDKMLTVKAKEGWARA